MPNGVVAMYLSRFSILLGLCFASNCFAAASEAFPGLTSIPIAGGYYEFKPKISFLSNLASVENRKLDNEADIFHVNLITVYLDQSKSTAYRVSYSEGYSADPVFSFLDIKNPTVRFDIPALEVYLPGNGFIYANGHTNNMFNARRKYEISAQKLVEVVQPYLYVGLDTEALSELAIYSDKTLQSKIAIIPKGGKMEVILNDGDFYLVKTQFGLIGWLKPGSAQKDTENGVRGLYFRGD